MLLLCSLHTDERPGLDAQSWQPEMSLAIIARKRQKSAGDD